MREEFYEEWEPGERERAGEADQEKEREIDPVNGHPNDHSNDYPPTIGRSEDRDDEQPLTDHDNAFRYGNPYGHPQPGQYQRPVRRLPEDNRYARMALMLGLSGMTLAMMGCCMNVYILFGAAIVSIAGMVTAILSKTERRMHPNASAGMVLSVVAMLITLFTVCSYSFMIRHPELIDEAMKMYESMGLLPPGM